MQNTLQNLGHLSSEQVWVPQGQLWACDMNKDQIQLPFWKLGYLMRRQVAFGPNQPENGEKASEKY